MSENVVYGFKVDMKALQRVPGSKDNSLLKKIEQSQKGLLKEFGMIFKEDAEDVGIKIKSVSEIISDIPAGKLDKDYARQYRRATELICRAFAQTLKGSSIMEGIWTGYRDDLEVVLKDIGLNMLAKKWCIDNVSFPWPSTAKEPKITWPIYTYFTFDEARTALTEFGKINLKKSLGLKKSPLFEYSSIQEVTEFLQQISKWLSIVVAPDQKKQTMAQGLIPTSGDQQGLLLIIDGDQ